MKERRADFIANIRLYTREEGGRQTPTPSTLFRCILVYEEENYDCALFLQDIGSLPPGFNGRVPIALLFPQYMKHRLLVGSHFFLREIRVIGEGTVQEIIP
jgi:hypothetical protein